MYHQKVREVEHCALNEDIFLQKPISNKDLVREIDNKINRPRSRPNMKEILKEKELIVLLLLSIYLIVVLKVEGTITNRIFHLSSELLYLFSNQCHCVYISLN
jgi:hypothetical protein